MYHDGARDLVLLIAAAFLVSGCGAPGNRPELGSVTGIVTLDGQPQAGVIVSFQPEKGRGSFGLTDEQGRYNLNYIFDVPGAKVGRHTVSISTPKGDDSDPSSLLIKERIPAQYNVKSTLTTDVQPGSNEIDCELTSY